MKNNGNGRRAPLLLMLLAVLLAVPALAADHSIGVGLHHSQTVDDLADDGFEDLEEEGTSGIVSYQFLPEGIFTLEADLEYFADGFGGSTEEAQEAIAEFAAERLLGYLNRGDTTFCVNLPNVQLAEVSGAHRILHIHRNQPGVMAELNRALASAGLNILGQHLKTDERTGYVITDVDRDYDPAALKALRSVAGTLRFRMLH